MFHYASLFFFFNDTATTEIYTLSLHDALPIFPLTARQRREDVRRPCRMQCRPDHEPDAGSRAIGWLAGLVAVAAGVRSEEHTSELQSHSDLVCRLLLEKKKKKIEKCRHRYHIG